MVTDPDAQASHYKQCLTLFFIIVFFIPTLREAPRRVNADTIELSIPTFNEYRFPI